MADSWAKEFQGKQSEQASAETEQWWVRVIEKLVQEISLLCIELASARDTIRGVQIQAGAVYVYIYIYMHGGTCGIIVVHAMYT